MNKSTVYIYIILYYIYYIYYCSGYGPLTSVLSASVGSSVSSQQHVSAPPQIFDTKRLQGANPWVCVNLAGHGEVKAMVVSQTLPLISDGRLEITYLGCGAGSFHPAPLKSQNFMGSQKPVTVFPQRCVLQLLSLSRSSSRSFVVFAADLLVRPWGRDPRAALILVSCLPRTGRVDGAIVVQPAGAQRAPSAWVLHPRVGQGGARCEEVPLASPLGHIGGASSPSLVFWRPYLWQLSCLILSFCFFFALGRLSFGWTFFLALLSFFLSLSPSALGLGAGTSFEVSGWGGSGATGSGAGWPGGSFPWTNLVPVGILWVLHWLLNYRAQKLIHQSGWLLSWLGWRLGCLQQWRVAALGWLILLDLWCLILWDHCWLLILWDHHRCLWSKSVHQCCWWWFWPGEVSWQKWLQCWSPMFEGNSWVCFLLLFFFPVWGCFFFWLVHISSSREQPPQNWHDPFDQRHQSNDCQGKQHHRVKQLCPFLIFFFLPLSIRLPHASNYHCQLDQVRRLDQGNLLLFFFGLLLLCFCFVLCGLFCLLILLGGLLFLLHLSHSHHLLQDFKSWSCEDLSAHIGDLVRSWDGFCHPVGPG